ncbi:MAG TPA: hypothetical protein VGD13_08405 [Xanthobacteraceae bacterium]|jgi:hypothetical protein
MATRQIAAQKERKAKTVSKETEAIDLQSDLQSVRVWRPKNVSTTVNGVDDIDVRDGSLLLLKRHANGRETCMVVFSPGQWITANVEPG